MQRPNFVGDAVRYSVVAAGSNVSTFTNTIVDAVDSSGSDSDTYGHTYSATVPIEFNSRLWVVDDATTTLDASMKLCFGVFIGANNDKGNVIYQCSGSINFGAATGALNGLYPVFARSGGVIVADNTAPQNLLVNPMILPNSNFVRGSQIMNCSCNIDVLKILDSTNSNSYFFGWVLIGGSAGCPLDNLIASTSIRAYVDEIECFNPSRQ